MKKLKRIIVLLLSLTLIICAFGAVTVNAVGENIISKISISNNSFEKTNITSDWSGVTPSDWKVESKNNTYQIQSVSGAYDGDRYLGLNIDPKVQTKNQFVFTTSKYSNITAGVPYKFGVKFLSGDVGESTCLVTVTVYDASNVKINSYQSELTSVTAINEWTDVSVAIPSNENAVKVKITITVNAKSNCGIDYVYGVTDIISTDAGASIRLSKDTPGLRFTGKVDKTFYDEYFANYGASVGMIIVPIDYVQSVGEFTVDALNNGGKAYLDIQAKIWNNSATIEQDGYYGFSCAIVNIKQNNVKREFCARTYIKYTLNNQTTYIYGEYDYISHARSIYSVANKAMEDIDDYDDIDQEIIIAYANGQIPTFN